MPHFDEKTTDNNVLDKQAIFELDINIPFAVPSNGAVKEVKIHSSTSWIVARIKFGEIMVRDPARLQLAYYNPFKPRGNRKPLPTSLDSDEEWRDLIDHVKKHEEAEAKKQGKGKGQLYVFELVDRSGNDEPKVSTL